MFQQQKTWDEIGQTLTQKFGIVGEEAYLRVKSTGTLNGKDWPVFKTAATLLLQKFGAHLSTEERNRFQEALNTAP